MCKHIWNLYIDGKDTHHHKTGYIRDSFALKWGIWNLYPPFFFMFKFMA